MPAAYIADDEDEASMAGTAGTSDEEAGTAGASEEEAGAAGASDDAGAAF